jgi:hypothetical protein
VLLHVLAHVELIRLCSSPKRNSASVLASSVLPTPEGPRKMNEPRALRVLQAGAGAADGLGDRLDGLLLADDPLVQLVLHAEQLGGLGLGELVDGDAGPQREHLGDGFLVDLVEQVDARRLDLGLLGVLLLEQLLLAVAQAAGLFEVAGLSTASFFCWTTSGELEFSSSL